ncbi:MAG TPA: hypothetical protein PKG96_10660, partial [Bacilli bacterium]|nr:hypothetical protein [Bacilli bacterium]
KTEAAFLRQYQPVILVASRAIRGLENDLGRTILRCVMFSRLIKQKRFCLNEKISQSVAIGWIELRDTV